VGITKWLDIKGDIWSPNTFFDGIYKERFEFIEKPRDVKKRISGVISDIDVAASIILEAPLGMSKTVAALATVDDLAKKTNRTGMFFAVATQATSNGIFTRIKDWLDYMGGEKSLRLIHGKAQLNDEFSSLPKSRNIHGGDR